MFYYLYVAIYLVEDLNGNCQYEMLDNKGGLEFQFLLIHMEASEP